MEVISLTFYQFYELKQGIYYKIILSWYFFQYHLLSISKKIFYLK